MTQSRRSVLRLGGGVLALGVANRAWAGECTSHRLANTTGAPGCPAPSRDEGRIPDPMTAYDEFVWTHGTITHAVYRAGRGPGVLLMHELTGLTRPCLDLAAQIAQHGFAVYLPLFFGRPGEASGAWYLSVCATGEFRCLASEKSNPVTPWLRSLTAKIHAECPGGRVGAIGMCLTGGLVLALMADDYLVAPIVSQPAAPFPAITDRQRRAFGIAPGEYADAIRRARNGVPVLGFRFTQDSKCPPERFDRLCHDIGPNFRRYEIDSSRYREFCLSRHPHSVLASEYVAAPGRPTYQARQIALAFLDDRLKGKGSG